jgi:hypothetical protein
MEFIQLLSTKVYNMLERTWWRLFQKRVVRTKFYTYVFIWLFIIIVDTNNILHTGQQGALMRQQVSLSSCQINVSIVNLVW